MYFKIGFTVICRRQIAAFLKSTRLVEEMLDIVVEFYPQLLRINHLEDI